jgi:hypothetical protein
MPQLDETGRDTELARYLYGAGRLDQATLQGLLTEARQGRPGGGTLAQAIVQRGLLPQAEVEASLHQLAAGSVVPARPSGRFEPAPSGRFSAAPRPVSSGSMPALPPPPPSSGALPAVGVPGHHARRPSGTYAASGSNLVNSVAGQSGGNRLRRSSGRFGALNEGFAVGQYRIVRPLGAGAMGQVYLAEHADTGGRYAVKTLLTSAGEEFIARFLREGEAQAKVDSHPNVLRVHGMGEGRGFHYLVTELASGGDLKEVLRKQERLPADGAARLGRDLARGLAHMHAVGVLHRDLKPANVLFDGDGIAKLADFGLARFEGAQSLTRTGDLVGTPVYMPPEQAMGLREQVGPKSDVYGLGAMLYHCLAGRPPFEGATTIEVVDKLTNHQAPLLTSLVPGIPPQLAQIVHRTLSKEADARPTAAELADSLDALLTPPPAAGEASSTSRRGPLPLLAAVAGLSLVALVVALGSLWTGEDAAGVAGASPSTGADPTVPVPGPVAPAEPEVPPVALAWPEGVERRYRLFLKTEGEIPSMGWMNMMGGGGQQQIRIVRGYDLALWHEPAPADAAAAAQGSGEDEEEWEEDHDDWDDGVSGAPEPAPEPGVVRLKARIEQFQIDWEAMGMAKSFDSKKEVAQDEDGRRFSQVLGKVFTLGMRADGEVVWVRGTDAIQDAVYAGDAKDAEDEHEAGDEGRRRRGRGDWAGGMRRMQERMSYHVPELGTSSVMRETLNTFFHVLPPAGRDLEEDPEWTRVAPAPWSIGSGWGGQSSQLAPPTIACGVEARSNGREGSWRFLWRGDNSEEVSEAIDAGRVLLNRKTRGKSVYEEGVLRSSELTSDSYSGKFQYEASRWGRGGNGGMREGKISGEQFGKLELLD